MPTTKKPEKLRPYLFHGVNVEWSSDSKEAIGECPWCGREDKFSINIETGKWRCWVCAEGTDKGGGNIQTFIRMLWERSYEQTTTEEYRELAADRKILYPDTLVEWGLARSILTGYWLIPGYDYKLRQATLYQYLEAGNRRRLLPTPTLGHHLFGLNLLNPEAVAVYVCEGPWDAIALWEVLSHCENESLTAGQPKQTNDRSSSVLQDCSVVAVPGCNTWLDDWTRLFEGKTVTLLFDNDHPRNNPKRKGKPSPSAGFTAVKRTAGLLLVHPDGPEDVSYLRWGAKGYTKELPSGYDLRDHLTTGGAGKRDTTRQSLDRRLTALKSIVSKVLPVPDKWRLRASTEPRGDNNPNRIKPLPCQSYLTLKQGWRKALRWTPGLDRALSVMLASVISTRTIGDQLWIKLIGPPASGKSTLCEALAVSSKYVLPKSIIRGFHSGWKSPDGKGQSLINELRDKTLVTKDGDTLLQSPNLGQILAEARDLYDGTSQSHYRNANVQNHSGIRTTWILCGTSSLRRIDSSELGERFLDCVIMDRIDDKVEDAILWRVVNRTDRNLAIESDGVAEQQYDPDLATAMSLTGGYVDYLRENAVSLLSRVESPEHVRRRCVTLGKFVAYMRARPSRHQNESEEREFAARLVSQHLRLAKCLAAVLNKPVIDYLVMQTVTKIALDTARGLSLDIVKELEHKSEGMGARGLSMLVNQSPEYTGRMLRFLKRIGVTRTTTSNVAVRRQGAPVKYQLTAKIRKLYEEVMEGYETDEPESKT